MGANGDETALDCGGSCPPCEIGQACREDDDCVGFLSCRGGWCMGRRCREDGVLNGAEVDVDCGAACAHACEVGAQCVGYSDCVGEARCRRGRCARPSCEDGVQNQRESDRDCGGPCAPCDDGAGCLRGEDCQSSSCVDDLCRPPACDDWVQNGDEEDVDCGGACCACIVCGPAAPEACNMVDDDRDGRVDEGVLRQPECIDNLVPALPLRPDESCVESDAPGRRTFGCELVMGRWQRPLGTCSPDHWCRRRAWSHCGPEGAPVRGTRINCFARPLDDLVEDTCNLISGTWTFDEDGRLHEILIEDGYGEGIPADMELDAVPAAWFEPLTTCHYRWFREAGVIARRCLYRGDAWEPFQTAEHTFYDLEGAGLFDDEVSLWRGGRTRTVYRDECPPAAE